MAKARVYELAKAFGVESNVVMAKLKELGESVRSASSTIEAPVVRKLTDALQGSESAALDQLRFRLAESGIEGDTDQDLDEWEEVTDEELEAYERDRYRSRRAAYEQDRLYQEGMQAPSRTVRHREETSEVADTGEIDQLREVVANLREDLDHLRKVAALAVETAALRKELMARPTKFDLAAVVSQLREEIAELHSDVERLDDNHPLARDLGDLESRVDNHDKYYDLITTLREDVGAKAQRLRDADAQLHKDVAALQREVATLLLRSEDRRPEEPEEHARPAMHLPPPSSYRRPDAIAAIMPETPAEVYRAQQAREAAARHLLESGRDTGG